ncbi:alpha/beta hydrolase fold domain-containing protein [Nocardia sp. SYP-A9097]|uniref:alpha/beta hydrolase fold domain-containing protein n=1 Tax=Nocardia sp. SYP-A9097 TaxID=2663237 RepID=UPI00129BE53B|nr:alpha/beta hydrolase [Nocardia sp. SYP-A9097]MRH89101.1 alpha/beta hydrolase fold domain-containing protein [Nocardia sp. SYP-A9097]
MTAFHASRVSFLSRRVVPAYLRIIRANQAFLTAEPARKHLRERSLRPKTYGPPRRLRSDVVVSVDHSRGWPIYTLIPRTGRPRSNVVYVHGGAWVNEIAPQHWQLAADIAGEVGTTVTVPIYPLVPFGTAEQVVHMIAKLVLDNRSRYGEVCLAGDSAGGQIALSAAQVLRDEHELPLPRTVLISPALDLSLSNPEIDVVLPTDPWLGKEGTRVFIELWRGELPLTDPRVSPLLGDMRGLGPLTVFSGTRDIVLPDTRLLVDKARGAGVAVDYHEGAGLVHVYPLTPTREGRHGRAQILEALRKALTPAKTAAP